MEENALQMDLSPPMAEKVIRKVARDSGRVFFTMHAETRMRERGINRTQVLRCLRLGRVVEGPARDTHGKWIATLEVLSAGDVVTVVAALDNDDTGNLVVVITVYR
ncbi:MAG TPA: DUF4258 domain-containing protein [Gammaproteobacteria bacterium]